MKINNDLNPVFFFEGVLRYLALKAPNVQYSCTIDGEKKTVPIQKVLLHGRSREELLSKVILSEYKAWHISPVEKTKRTKLFFDTEFTGLHQNTTLISIGIVSECGKIFYAELNDFDQSQVDKWLQDNVIDSMFLTRLMKIGEDGHFWEGCELHACNMETLKVRLEKWLSQFESIEMWSDCLAYDWMLFCQIFGHAFSIPKHVHYIPFDICTLFKSKGIDPDISREEFGGENIYDGVKLKLNGAPTHNALRDSFLIRSCYNNLQLL